MDCIIISEDDTWAQQLEAKLSHANIQVARHSNKSYPTTEATLYLVDAANRQPDIADCGKRILLFTDQPNAQNVLQLPRTNAPQWLLNHLGMGSKGLPETYAGSSTEGQIIVNDSGKILNINESMAICLSGLADDWHNTALTNIFPELTSKTNYPIRRQLTKLCHQGQPCRGQLFSAKNKNGHNRYFEISVNQLVGARFLLHCRDVTQRTSSHNAMRQKARFDALTGLPNRQLLMDRLRMALARSKRFQRQLAVMYVDLDHFKPINDTWGHAAGDAILREASIRMKEAVREIDTVARLGGDEFIIVIEDLKDHRDAGIIADNILSTLAKHFSWRQHEFHIGCSIGITLSDDSKEDANRLIEKADLALYRAKSKGRQRFEFCTPDLTAQARYKMVLQEELHKALQENQLELHFQPIVSTDNQIIEGAEVLLRWQHPKVGMVSPKDFVPLLEQTGLIIPVGEWIIEKACQQWVQWKTTGLIQTSARMSINISNCQFASPQLISYIQRITSRLNMPINTLALEINEELLNSDRNGIAESFKQLTNSGINIIIDDFGLGTTSINSLSKFNLTAIKLEKPLIQSLSDTEGDNSLMAFSALAHSLNISMIAEGIDDQNQLESLIESGVDSYQGYSFCVPMNALNFENFISNHNRFENNFKKIS